MAKQPSPSLSQQLLTQLRHVVETTAAEKVPPQSGTPICKGKCQRQSSGGFCDEVSYASRTLIDSSLTDADVILARTRVNDAVSRCKPKEVLSDKLEVLQKAHLFVAWWLHCSFVLPFDRFLRGAAATTADAGAIVAQSLHSIWESICGSDLHMSEPQHVRQGGDPKTHARKTLRAILQYMIRTSFSATTTGSTSDIGKTVVCEAVNIVTKPSLAMLELARHGRHPLAVFALNSTPSNSDEVVLHCAVV